MDHEQLYLLLHVCGAIALGGIIGFEREQARKPAGLRTHMLVSGAAALLVGIGDSLAKHYASSTTLTLTPDPIRIVEAIIVGIGFLCAGTIFRHKESDQIEGLTTAGSLLFAAAIGISCALELWVVAVGSVVLALIILRGAMWFEMKLHHSKPAEEHKTLTMAKRQAP